MLVAKSTGGADQGRARPTNKLEERRAELARFAVATMARRGFANTSLRDIANDSPYSHGVLHYYFTDKWELVAHCLTLFNGDRADWVAAMLEAEIGAADFRTAVARSLADGIREHTSGYIVWYDLRSQPGLNAAVAEVVRRIDRQRQAGGRLLAGRHAELAEARLVFDADTIYAMVDGLVEHTVRRYAAGDDDALPWLEREVNRFLEVSVGGSLSAVHG